MTTFALPTDAPLPTLERLQATLPPDLDAKDIATTWFTQFATAAETADTAALSALFVPDAFWRDILALTWDFRTFHPLPVITQFLSDRLGSGAMRLTALKLRDDDYLQLQQPYPDLAWVHAMFDFEVAGVGPASGVVRLVPSANGEWRAHTVFTNLEDLTGFPERLGPLRNQAPNHGKWAEDRRRQLEFKDEDPAVLIVGGGQSGLEVAARLKCLDISSLVVEKNPRIGDNWRNRYDALCLHDPVWYDHMPYLPFPPTWPVYTPALKLANWLENYAESLELNVWTSATVVKASQDSSSKKWTVYIKRGDEERTFTVKHLVFAMGLGDGAPNFPKYPGADKFKGQILHSSQHKKATDHVGKKVVIVGSCTSAHDIAVDYHNHDVDVTMFQRSSTYIMTIKNGWKYLMEGVYSEKAPPVDIADRLNASYPNYMSIGITQRRVRQIAEADKELLDGLRNRGFKLNMGSQGTGFALLAWGRAGGYYLDTGGSKLIADGKIKLKGDGQIETFTETGLRFDNGSELAADVVVFATGLGDARAGLRKICGDEVAGKCKPLWGLNSEGEINGAWRDLGVPGLWYMMGNLALCRFHSKHVALQIKAIEEGIFDGTRYSAAN